MNSPLWTKLVVIVVVVAGAPSALAASVALRAKSNHQGTMILLGDIADISAASTTELNDLVTTALMPAPAPGASRYLRRAEIRDLLAARGIDLGAISLSGADIVEIGKPSPPVETEAESRPTPEQIEASLHASIKHYLSRQTGHAQWKVETPPDSAAFLRIAKLGVELTASGGRKPWIGKQYFKIAGADSDQEITVVATVTKIQPVVTALRAIQRGELVRATDVEITQHEGNLSSAAVSSLADAIGMEAQRSIQAGTILLQSHLTAPLLVERGETVTVFARTAGITVRTFAVARENGARGDLVQIETLDGEERFAARVSGRRQLEVLAAGATPEDFASLPRHEAIQR